MSDPSTNLTLQELHDETGRLLASFLMPDALTNVLSVKLDGAGVQRVKLEVSDIDKLERVIAGLKDDLADAELTIDDLRDELRKANEMS